MPSRHALTLWSTVAIVTLVLFVEILHDVLTQSGLTRVDGPLTVAIAAVSLTRWRTIRPVVLVGAAYGGAAFSYGILKPAVGRLRRSAALQYGPPDTGLAFPSGHTTQSSAFFGMLAVLLFISAGTHRK